MSAQRTTDLNLTKEQREEIADLPDVRAAIALHSHLFLRNHPLDQPIGEVVEQLVIEAAEERGWA